VITRIKLSNFKAHESLDLAGIPRLAALVGRNNSGKSAVLHAAALTKYRNFYRNPFLPLGELKDIPNNPDRPVDILLSYKGTNRNIRCLMGPRTEQMNIGWTEQPPPKPDPSLGIFYLSAFRVASEGFQYTRMADEVGFQGESTWNILHQLKANDDDRFAAIKEWISRMHMGITNIGTPTVQPNSGSIAPESYGRKNNLVLNGSGVAAVLPIITQGILADPGQTLLIEEPESHLHRGAMDELLKFFGQCAERDVQILFTTHSLDFLVSMSERCEDKKIPEDSKIFHIIREPSGSTRTDLYDPNLFYGISQTIKKDLAGRLF